jgi:hypothetical protein
MHGEHNVKKKASSKYNWKTLFSTTGEHRQDSLGQSVWLTLLTHRGYAMYNLL